jgi:hypothetical protein
MFTIIASLAGVLIVWGANRAKDRPTQDRLIDNDADMRMVACVLAMIVVMLGMIADRIHYSMTS